MFKLVLEKVEEPEIKLPTSAGSSKKQERSNQSILKEISPGNDAKDETPVLWVPHVKSWLIGKASDAGRDWGQEEKGTTEDEIAGWHHGLDGCESEWTLGVGDGQGGLVCCDAWGRKESDTTEWLNCTELNWSLPVYKDGIILPKVIYRINVSSIKITVAFFTEIEKKIQKTVNSQRKLEKKELS